MTWFFLNGPSELIPAASHDYVLHEHFFFRLMANNHSP